MLGSTVMRFLSSFNEYHVTGTVRSQLSITYLPKFIHSSIIKGIDILEVDALERLFDKVKPEVVINCIGLVKQLSETNDPLITLPINSLFPHRLAKISANFGARLIHMSTDCVFAGIKGMYTESDITDAQDLYGVSKRLGEVDYPNAVTIRTSIIGHELNGSRSLVDWFLSQEIVVKGFKRAVFSGLPTIEIARIIRDYLIPIPQLTGVYHVSADPINKFDLLSLVVDIYRKDIRLEEDNDFVIDRSLDSSRFREKTGYTPPSWQELITSMRDTK